MTYRTVLPSLLIKLKRSTCKTKETALTKSLKGAQLAQTPLKDVDHSSETALESSI